MTIVLCGFMVWLLLRSSVAMGAAETAAGLFVRAVMPGLFPYMTLALMLTSRLPADVPEGVLTVVGWCGGSPTGARLLRLRPEMPASKRKCLAVTCATMSPMFLVGTVPQWTGVPVSGVVLLAAMVAGGALTGWLAGLRCDVGQVGPGSVGELSPLSLGEAVEQASRTMLVVCGTMMLLRVAAALAGEAMAGFPGLRLAMMTLLEVTSGTAELARLGLPLAERTGLIAAATGFGGTAILLQNRAMYPEGLLTLCEQVGWQAVHGLISGGLAYGLMLLITKV